MYKHTQAAKKANQNKTKKRTEKIMGLTALHCSIFPERIFKPSSTISPAMMALVVAIAGMMFPAMAAEQAEREISLACKKKREGEQKLEKVKGNYLFLHLISKRLFIFILKICILRFAAAVTKSNAGGSSYPFQGFEKKDNPSV